MFFLNVQLICTLLCVIISTGNYWLKLALITSSLLIDWLALHGTGDLKVGNGID